MPKKRRILSLFAFGLLGLSLAAFVASRPEAIGPNAVQTDTPAPQPLVVPADVPELPPATVVSNDAGAKRPSATPPSSLLRAASAWEEPAEIDVDENSSEASGAEMLAPSPAPAPAYLARAVIGPAEPLHSRLRPTNDSSAQAPPASSQLGDESYPRIARANIDQGEGDGQLNINIPDSDLREVLDMLSKAGDLNILASKNVSGRVKASLTGVDVDTALNAILRSTGYVARREGSFVYVGTPEDFQVMDQSADRIGTRVYRPNYITAAELQTLITPMLTSGVGTVSVSSAAEAGISSDGSNTGGDNFAGAETVLVRDFQNVLIEIDQVFEEVDRRPLQVSIEAMILSVRLTDENSLGVNFELFRDSNHLRVVSGAPLANLADIDVANNSGLKIGFLDSNLALFVDALEKIGETHVIAQPRLMCLNKQRAEIHIGEQRGYVSTTVTETASTQAVEFLELGTQLRLRPFISSDGLIRMEVHPELSTGNVEVTEGFTLPNKNVTQVTTNVMVRDGATMVLGGLIREDLTMNSNQIPVLGALPWMGFLFRQKTDKIVRDEIVVLITPRIVWEPQFNCEGEYANCEFHQQHAIFYDKMSCLSQMHYARRFTRLAKAAWVAGDAHTALRYSNLAIHFDKVNREAIQLRSEIIANSPYGDATVDKHLKDGLFPWQWPLKAGKLTNWVLDELHGPHTHVGQAPAPVYDPGVTGPRVEVQRPEMLEIIEPIDVAPFHAPPSARPGAPVAIPPGADLIVPEVEEES